jgi:hypothetical protein
LFFKESDKKKKPRKIPGQKNIDVVSGVSCFEVSKIIFYLISDTSRFLKMISNFTKSKNNLIILYDPDVW